VLTGWVAAITCQGTVNHQTQHLLTLCKEDTPKECRPHGFLEVIRSRNGTNRHTDHTIYIAVEGELTPQLSEGATELTLCELASSIADGQINGSV
jgi:hypothetical protein